MAETRYVTLAEARDMLEEKREERGGFIRKAQDFALSHAMDYPLSQEQETELIGKLLGLGFVTEPVAFKIADLLPNTSNEVRAIFVKEHVTLDKDMIQSILDIVSQY